MKLEGQRKLIAIVGGSGSGKSWLADRLQRAFGNDAARLSLDSFYLDRGHLPLSRRERLNFDHPRAIDWRRFETALRQARTKNEVNIPQYNFGTHTRLPHDQAWTPAPLVLVDGLWLMARGRVRRLFDFCLYLDCPGQLRLERRLSRDIAERGRTPASVREQFWKTVMPMHERHVAGQLLLADLVLQQPSSETEIEGLVATLRHLAPALRQGGEDVSLPGTKLLQSTGTSEGPTTLPPSASAARAPLPMQAESMVAHSLLL